MKKTQILRTIIWFLCFSVSLFLLFVLPEDFNIPQIWITLVFDAIAFVSQLVLWNIISAKLTDADKGFFNTPTLTISAMYLIIQSILCIVVASIGNGMNTKGVLIINFLIMVFAWIVLLLTVMSKDHVERIEKRQKDHHTEL